MAGCMFCNVGIIIIELLIIKGLNLNSYSVNSKIPQVLFQLDP
jgi:hypothetical protein